MAHRLPPENYPLNAFLLGIAEEITDEDLHKMKSLLKGPGGIGRGILEDISGTMDFFDRLQTTGLVTVNDIVVLQALLWTIGKKDVYEKMVQFADQHGDVLHISSPNPEPANGYKYVKFHLKGKLVKGKVEDLRASVAAWLRVPTHFVVISGVQPTGSWYITLMVPEICREKLLKLAVVKRQWLIQQEIDSVELDGKVIDLREDDSSNTDQTEEDDMSRKEIVRLAEVNKDLEEEIEILLSELIKAKRQPFTDWPGEVRRDSFIKRLHEKFRRNIKYLRIYITHLESTDTEILLMTPSGKERSHTALENIIWKSSMCREHIKRIRKKMHLYTTSDHTEYDKLKPDRISEHNVARGKHVFLRDRHLVRSALWMDGGPDLRPRNICRRAELNVLEVESYLKFIEQEVEMILSISAQSGQVMWFKSRTTSIDEELQSFDMVMKEMVESLERCDLKFLEGLREPDFPEVYGEKSDASLALIKILEEKSDKRSTTSESETSSSPTEGTNPKTLGF